MAANPARRQGRLGPRVHHIGCRVEIDALHLVDLAVSIDQRLDEVCRVSPVKPAMASRICDSRCFDPSGSQSRPRPTSVDRASA